MVIPPQERKANIPVRVFIKQYNREKNCTKTSYN